MNDQELQARIDAIEWYHEFDFPGGLKVRNDRIDSESHRKLWSFSREILDTIDFRGKSVLDIGSWDGYWSFYAEQHGAASVLATDELTQNWAAGEGIFLAKELLGSQIEIDFKRDVYDIASLGQTFDIILFLGVYYHLHAPFFALTQIRQLCRPDTIVVVEGDVRQNVGTEDALFGFARMDNSTFNPSRETMEMMLKAAYLDVTEQHFIKDTPSEVPKKKRPVLRTQWKRMRRWIKGTYAKAKPYRDRGIFVCKPFVGNNDHFYYKPPFGLAAFDTRYGASEGSDP